MCLNAPSRSFIIYYKPLCFQTPMDLALVSQITMHKYLPVERVIAGAAQGYAPANVSKGFHLPTSFVFFSYPSSIILI